MSRFRLLPLLLCALLAAGAGRAEVRWLAAGPDTKPADPDYRYLPAAFDCTAAVDTLVLAPGSVDTLRGDNTGAPRQNPSYPCAPWNEPGGEHVYRLEVTADLELTAVLIGVDPTVDHDLFLLGGCDTDSCLVGVNTEFTALLTPDVYYLVIDSTLSGILAEGPYTVALEMRYPGVPPQACSLAGLEPWDCADTVESHDLNLYGTPDLVRAYDCAVTATPGGESWHRLTVPTEATLTVTALPDTARLDPALWLFDGCGPDAVCLGHANANTGGLPETLAWTNDTGADDIVFLAVDCFRAPDDATLGGVTVEVRCEPPQTPSERSPFGSFKALYR